MCAPQSEIVHIVDAFGRSLCPFLDDFKCKVDWLNDWSDVGKVLKRKPVEPMRRWHAIPELANPNVASAENRSYVTVRPVSMSVLMATTLSPVCMGACVHVCVQCVRARVRTGTCVLMCSYL